MAKRVTDNYPVKWIPVSECGVVWPSAQRTITERIVNNIVAEFDPDKLGVIHVAEKNGKGLYHPCDGQHRIEALKRMGYSDQLVLAMVYPIHTAAEAAAMFNGLNNSTRPNATALFKTHVTEGVEPALGISKVLKSCGYHIGVNAESARAIAAVGAVTEIYRKFGAGALRDTLDTISATWRDDPDATLAPIIKGFGLLIGEQGALIDYPRLREKVAKKGTAASLFGAARARKSALGGKLPEHVRDLLVQFYNDRLRGGEAKLV